MQKSEKSGNQTKAISIRELTTDDKDRIRELLKYGDASKIAVNIPHLGYQHIMNVLSPKHEAENDVVWEQAIKFLNNLPEIEIDYRLEQYIKRGVAA